MPLLAAQPARAQNDPTIHMVTYIDVAPAAKDQAAALLKPLAEASRKDAGNLLFRFFNAPPPPTSSSSLPPGRISSRLMHTTRPPTANNSAARLILS